MKRKTYSKKLKESVFKRLSPPNAEKVPTLSEELNIPKTTLYTWRSKVLKESSATSKKANKWTSNDKFQAVLETASLSELETSKYCREKGIHLKELKIWKKQCQNANNIKLEAPEKLKDNLKTEKQKNKELQKELGISSRTYQRWTKNGGVKKDQRPLVKRKEPKNKLSQIEREKIIKVSNSKKYADLPPSKIVPKLADKGQYIASESTFYRVLKEEKLITHRSKSKEPETYKKAKAANPERWSGNIRDWSLPEYVTLNPMKEEKAENYFKQQSS